MTLEQQNNEEMDGLSFEAQKKYEDANIRDDQLRKILSAEDYNRHLELLNAMKNQAPSPSSRMGGDTYGSSTN